MNGIERLNALIDEHWPLPLPDGEVMPPLAWELREIALEIKSDFKCRPGTAWNQLGEYMNKLLDGSFGDIDDPGIYRRMDGVMTFQDWLDHWYIPKPLDADGEPFDFNKLYDHGCGAIEKIRIHKADGEYGYVIVSHDGNNYYPRGLHAEVDPWEELRCEIEYALQCGYSPEEANVAEWIEKAKKLAEEER